MSRVSPFLDDNMDIWVGAAWFSPKPFGRNDYKSSDDDDDDESPVDDDTDGDDESSAAADDDESPVDDDDTDGDNESGDVLSSSLNHCSWCHRFHKHKPWSSTAVEIFSVFIGQEKSKAVQIYGSIEVLRDEGELCYIFKRDENEALWLSENLKSIPIPDGSRRL